MISYRTVVTFWSGAAGVGVIATILFSWMMIREVDQVYYDVLGDLNDFKPPNAQEVRRVHQVQTDCPVKSAFQGGPDNLVVMEMSVLMEKWLRVFSAQQDLQDHLALMTGILERMDKLVQPARLEIPGQMGRQDETARMARMVHPVTQQPATQVPQARLEHQAVLEILARTAKVLTMAVPQVLPVHLGLLETQDQGEMTDRPEDRDLQARPGRILITVHVRQELRHPAVLRNTVELRPSKRHRTATVHQMEEKLLEREAVQAAEAHYLHSLRILVCLPMKHLCRTEATPDLELDHWPQVALWIVDLAARKIEKRKAIAD
ncbi:hypothetical protein QR680_010049 [Steinernema hermaphroditum]|uniref:Uncharacterized protein n=1 Tax=Steinernema hermaphroditum TaxID=289476 RepID=A0AA39IQ03_9BILA|nr:hypothetical protein QR680_010049 [Steinernema hermaphroditum]